VEIILSKPVGLDLEWTNGVPYICIYFLFFFQRLIIAKSARKINSLTLGEEGILKQ